MEQTAQKEKYRWENGRLYVLTGNAYIHCFHNAKVRSKKKAIEAYEEALMNDPFED
jgi:phage terminase large subunit-like protein